MDIISFTSNLFLTFLHLTLNLIFPFFIPFLPSSLFCSFPTFSFHNCSFSFSLFGQSHQKHFCQLSCRIGVMVAKITVVCRHVAAKIWRLFFLTCDIWWLSSPTLAPSHFKPTLIVFLDTWLSCSYYSLVCWLFVIQPLMTLITHLCKFYLL